MPMEQMPAHRRIMDVYKDFVTTSWDMVDLVPSKKVLKVPTRKRLRVAYSVQCMSLG